MPLLSLINQQQRHQHESLSSKLTQNTNIPSFFYDFLHRLRQFTAEYAAELDKYSGNAQNFSNQQQSLYGKKVVKNRRTGKRHRYYGNNPHGYALVGGKLSRLIAAQEKTSVDEDRHVNSFDVQPSGIVLMENDESISGEHQQRHQESESSFNNTTQPEIETVVLKENNNSVSASFQLPFSIQQKQNNLLANSDNCNHMSPAQKRKCREPLSIQQRLENSIAATASTANEQMPLEQLEQTINCVLPESIIECDDFGHYLRTYLEEFDRELGKELEPEHQIGNKTLTEQQGQQFVHNGSIRTRKSKSVRILDKEMKQDCVDTAVDDVLVTSLAKVPDGNQHQLTNKIPKFPQQEYVLARTKEMDEEQLAIMSISTRRNGDTIPMPESIPIHQSTFQKIERQIIIDEDEPTDNSFDDRNSLSLEQNYAAENVMAVKNENAEEQFAHVDEAIFSAQQITKFAQHLEVLDQGKVEFQRSSTPLSKERSSKMLARKRTTGKMLQKSMDNGLHMAQPQSTSTPRKEIRRSKNSNLSQQSKEIGMTSPKLLSRRSLQSTPQGAHFVPKKKIKYEEMEIGEGTSNGITRQFSGNAHPMLMAPDPSDEDENADDFGPIDVGIIGQVLDIMHSMNE